MAIIVGDFTPSVEILDTDFISQTDDKIRTIINEAGTYLETETQSAATQLETSVDTKLSEVTNNPDFTYTADAIDTKIANVVVTQTPINISTILDGSFSIVGTDLVASGVVGSISNGIDSTGSNNEVFALSDGIITPTNGYADGDNYLKTTASGTVTSTLVKPIYGEKFVNTDTTDIIPTMTSTTAPSGIAFASSEYPGGTNPIWHVFNDNVASNDWASASGDVVGAYIGYIFSGITDISKMILTFENTAFGDIYRVQSSLDTTNGTDGTWTDEATISEAVVIGSKTIELGKVSGKGFRVIIDSMASGSVVYLGQMELIAYDDRVEADYYLDGLWHNSSDVVYNPQQTYLSENGKLVKVTASGGVPSTITLEDDAPSIVEDCIQVGKLIANDIKSPLAVSARCSFNGVGSISINEAIGVSGITRLSTAYYRIFDDSSNLGRAVVATMSYPSYGGVELVGVYDGYFEIKLYNTSGGVSESGADLITCIISGGYN